MSLIKKYITEYLTLDTNNIPFVLKITEVKLFGIIPLYYKESGTCNRELVSKFIDNNNKNKIGFKQQAKKKRSKNGNKVQVEKSGADTPGDNQER